MTDWQMKLDTVLERDNYVLQHQMWTDCIFVVGDEKQEVKFHVHRLMLAKSSPALAAMLYGDMYHEGEEIRVTDISPQVFKAMLRYMYEGQVQVGSFEVASDLLYAAKKYLLPESLVRQCRATVLSLLPDNVWASLQFARDNDEPDLEDEAWKIVQRCVADLISQPEFLQLPQSTMVALVQQDSLMVESEFQLYESCLGWAGSEVERERGDVKDPTVLREVLAPVLPHIRFLNMTSEQLAEGPILSGILTEKEGLRLLMKVASPNIKIEVPEGFCSIKEFRYLQENSEIFASVKSSPDNLPTLETWSSCNFNCNAGGSGVFKGSCILLGVQLPTQVKHLGCKSDTYNEDLTVLLCNHDTKKVYATRFTGNVTYNSVVDVPFRENIGFGGIKCENMELRILFHTTGCYPRKYSKEDVPLPGKFPLPGNFGWYEMAKYDDRSKDFKFIYKIVFTLIKG